METLNCKLAGILGIFFYEKKTIALREKKIAGSQRG